MPKRKRKEPKAKQYLGKRKHSSFWQRNKDKITADIIVRMLIKGVEAVGKLLLDNLF